MEIDFPTDNIPATTEHVLAVFRDWHRHNCHLGEADPAATLNFDTSMKDWWWANGDDYLFVDCRQFARGLNKSFGIKCTDAEWREVLVPARKKRLGGVCELIAKHATQPQIRPTGWFGCTCRAAGAFLTVRSILHDAGAPADDITPSSLLQPFICRYLEVFLGPISRLAPGSLPLIRVQSDPLVRTGRWSFVIGLVSLFGGFCIGSVLFAAIGIVLLIGGVSLVVYTQRNPLSFVEFGELKTFRDFALVIAEEKPFAQQPHLR